MERVGLPNRYRGCRGGWALPPDLRTEAYYLLHLLQLLIGIFLFSLCVASQLISSHSFLLKYWFFLFISYTLLRLVLDTIGRPCYGTGTVVVARFVRKFMRGFILFSVLIFRRGFRAASPSSFRVCTHPSFFREPVLCGDLDETVRLPFNLNGAAPRLFHGCL